MRFGSPTTVARAEMISARTRARDDMGRAHLSARVRTHLGARARDHLGTRARIEMIERRLGLTWVGSY